MQTKKLTLYLPSSIIPQINLPRIFYTASAVMAKRRARIEEQESTRKMDKGWCFDEECRLIRTSRIECKPFSDALVSLNSDQTRRSSNRVHISLLGIAKKLKNRAIFRDDCVRRGVDVMSPLYSSKEKQKELKLEIGSRRKKIDVSEKDFLVDAILAANRDVCDRLIMERRDDCSWTRKDNQYCCSAGAESSFSLSTDDEAQDELEIVETNDVLHSKAPNDEHSTSDSVSDNDFPSTPPSTNGFNVAESSKSQEEHESPVSVLDQFLSVDYSHYSSTIVFQIGKKSLKPRRLCFDECSNEQVHNVSHYAHLVFKSSSLNWGHISSIRPLSEELLHHSSYEEVEHLFLASRFDTRLLFDRMNEVLLQMQRSPTTERRRNHSRLALEETVVDEIQREAEFYQTNERTLDQIVAKDVGDCRLWFDLVLESEHAVMIHISSQIMEECILDVMLNI